MRSVRRKRGKRRFCRNARNPSAFRRGNFSVPMTKQSEKGAHALNKADRVLILCYRLFHGERIKKRLFMDEFSVGRRSFDRYIESVRLMLSETFAPHELLYDAIDRSYYLSGIVSERLRGINILPLLLLLFESRAFGENDAASILQGLLMNLSSDDRGHIETTIRRLSASRAAPSPHLSLLKMLWDLNLVIDRQQKIRLYFSKSNVGKDVLPMRLSFSHGEIILQVVATGEIPEEYALSEIRYFTPL